MAQSKDNSIMWEFLALVVLLAIGGAVVWYAFNYQSQASKDEELAAKKYTRVVKAGKDLPAFHLLEQNDFDVDTFPDEEHASARTKYADRRLLTALKKGDAVTDAALAPAATKDLLNNPLTASIPATPATTLGGRLAVGDVVELASVGAPKGAGGGGAAGAAAPDPVNRAQGLVVVGLSAQAQAAGKPADGATAPPGAIVLAFTADKFDAFMKAVGGKSLVLLRPNPGPNQ